MVNRAGILRYRKYVDAVTFFFICHQTISNLFFYILYLFARFCVLNVLCTQVKRNTFLFHNFTSTISHSSLVLVLVVFVYERHVRKCELVLIHLCYTGISSFAGDLINSVICLEEASNSTCVTSVAGLCLRIRVAHNQDALCIFGAPAIEYNTANPYFPSKQFEPEDN